MAHKAGNDCSYRKGRGADLAYLYGQFNSNRIVDAWKNQNDPRNNADKDIFNIGYLAAVGNLHFSDVPEKLRSSFTKSSDGVVNLNALIKLEDIPTDIREHISFSDGYSNGLRAMEGKKAHQEALSDPFYDYDRGFMFYINGIELNRIRKEDLNNPKFMLGYKDACYSLQIDDGNRPLNFDNDEKAMYIKGKEWALKGYLLEDASDEYQYSTAFIKGYEETIETRNKRRTGR